MAGSLMLKSTVKRLIGTSTSEKSRRMPNAIMMSCCSGIIYLITVTGSKRQTLITSFPLPNSKKLHNSCIRTPSITILNRNATSPAHL